MQRRAWSTETYEQKFSSTKMHKRWNTSEKRKEMSENTLPNSRYQLPHRNREDYPTDGRPNCYEAHSRPSLPHEPMWNNADSGSDNHSAGELDQQIIRIKVERQAGVITPRTIP